ncbi:PAS domain-containing protein, partial [Thermodesulfobacteriota bacterium]
MTEKNSYEELQRRIKALEKESEARAATEKVLRENEKKYRMFFEHAGYAIDLMDAETGKRVDFNRKAYESLGYTREEYKDIRIQEIEVKESPDDIKKHISKIIEQGSDSFETILKTKTGEIRDMFVSAVPILIDGKYFIQNIQIDITESKLAEKALRESEERYRSLVESTEDFIYLVNTNCEYLFMNEKYLSRLGLSLDQLAGKSYADFHPSEDTDEFTKKINKTVKTGKSIQHEHKSSRDNRYFLRTLSPMKNTEGKIFS